MAIGLIALVGMAATRVPTAFVATAGEPVTVTVGGKAMRFAIAPNGMGFPVLNPDAAKTLGLEKGFLRADTRVGPVKIDGGTTVLPFAMPGIEPGKRRLLWFDRPIAEGVDGEIGPAALPQPVVTFRLRAPQADERPHILPLASRFGGLGSVMKIGAVELYLQWDPARADSLASAAAGQLIAGAHGGRLTGPVGATPIRLGVSRPVRQLELDRPFVAGPGSLPHIMVRVADYGDVNGVADAEADESEIVVNARSKQKPVYRVTIGRDGLVGCSSITFDKPAKTVTLSCR